MVFFVNQKTAYEMRISDWSSDVCSSDLIDALREGGVDFILIETIVDTLNAKAGVLAAIEAGEARGTEVPLMISMTLTDMSGRNLSGHSVEAFWAAIRHARDRKSTRLNSSH